jgi:hypothetical protein
MMSISLIALPVLFDTTPEASLLFKEWVRLYHYGHQVLPTMAVATCFLYGFTAINKRAARQRWGIFAVAGVTTVLMLPFTWIFMAPTNNILFGLEAESKVAAVASLSEAHAIVNKWKWLHIVRSLFPLTGAILGLTGIFK